MSDVAKLVMEVEANQADRASKSLDDLTASAKKTETATERMRREAEQTNSRFVDLTGATKDTGTATQRMAKEIEAADSKFVQLEKSARSLYVGIGLVATSIVGIGLQKGIQEFRSFESGVVNVAKTTGLAGAELESFSARIDQISREIPVSTEELLGLAMAAGQMGVTGAENLEKFTLTIAKLGRASDLSGEEAATALARILNVTGENISQIDVLASVIVSLGNNIEATESEITRMTTEVARATATFGLSSAEAAALGAAMISMGIRAELGGSSVGRVMQEINKAVQSGGRDLEDFADTLGVNGKVLADTFKEDRVAGLMMFLEAIGSHGDRATIVLEELGLGGQEIAKVIPVLAGNLEKYAQTQALAAAEAENATALDREFEAQLKTLNSTIDITTNIVASLARAMSIDLAGSINVVLRAFNSFFQSEARFNSTVSAMKFVVRTAADAINPFSVLGDAVDFLGGRQRKADERFVEAATAMGKLGGVAGTVSPALEGVADATNEAADATERVSEETYRYGKDVEIASTALDAHVKLFEEHTKEVDRGEKALAKMTAELDNERRALGMTERGQYLLNVEIRAMAAGIEAEAIPALIEAAGRTYDLALAQEQATDRTERLARESERAAEQMADDWRETRQAFGEFFADMVQDGNSAFDALLQSFERMLLEMTGQLALSGIMKLAGVELPGSNGGISGILDSSGTAGSLIRAASSTPGFDKFMSNAGFDKIKDSFSYIGATDDAGNAVGFQKDMFLEGMKTLGLNIAGAYVGGKVGNKLGESIFSKEAESNIGQQIGSAIGTWLGGAPGAFIGSTLGSMLDVAAGGDGYIRQNAGMLVGNTPGAKSEHTFAVDPFASGLQVTGFARREDQATAKQLIDQFRNIDSVFTSLVRDLGGSLHVTSLAGLNQEATPGSSGTYLGTGRDADLAGQVNWFVDQLADHVTGLDEALLESIRSAGSAEGAIQLLNDALERQTRLQHMDGLRNLIGTDAVSMAREQYSAQTGLLHVYQQTNDAVRMMASGYTGTVEQTMAMTQALQMQRSSAYDLTTAYLQTQTAVESLFGGLTESIRKSVMGEQELYDYERAQVDSLTSLLGTLTDPEALYSTAQEIERRVSGMWSRLDEAARPGMEDGFIDYLDRTQELLQDRLSTGLASVEKTQTDINELLLSSLESAASQITSAAEMERQTAELNRQSAAMNLQAAQIQAANARNASREIV